MINKLIELIKKILFKKKKKNNDNDNDIYPLY